MKTTAYLLGLVAMLVIVGCAYGGNEVKPYVEQTAKMVQLDHQAQEFELAASHVHGLVKEALLEEAQKRRSESATVGREIRRLKAEQEARMKAQANRMARYAQLHDNH